MKFYLKFIVGIICFVSVITCYDYSVKGAKKDHTQSHKDEGRSSKNDKLTDKNSEKMVKEGRQIFRFDTFGDEEFWGGTLKLHQAIAEVSPNTALSLGLKVDADALSESFKRKLKQKKIDLDDPAITLKLLKDNAIVGVTGFFDTSGNLVSMGIQCALCHSTVDDSFDSGIGKRLDGWANRDLNVGAIVAIAPDLTFFTTLLGVDDVTVRAVLNGWGAGKFDAELALDGKTTNDAGTTSATLIPSAFGLAGVNLHTWTGWGSVTHWNAFVANLEMHGKGRFFDPRLNNSDQFPIAAREGFGDVKIAPENDQITPKLAALHFYQLAIPAPIPGEGSFNKNAAERGKALFRGKADCNRCHVEPLWTEPGWNMHTSEEIGIDDFQANRAPDKRYRTSPLAGLFSHQKGGFYHDGRFATLGDVIDHYNTFLNLGLTDSEKSDLIEFLKSI